MKKQKSAVQAVLLWCGVSREEIDRLLTDPDITKDQRLWLQARMRRPPNVPSSSWESMIQPVKNGTQIVGIGVIAFTFSTSRNVDDHGLGADFTGSYADMIRDLFVGQGFKNVRVSYYTNGTLNDV